MALKNLFTNKIAAVDPANPEVNEKLSPADANAIKAKIYELIDEIIAEVSDRQAAVTSAIEAAAADATTKANNAKYAATVEAGNLAIELADGARDSAINQIKQNVPTAGDNLLKLYNLVIAQFSQVTVASVAARNAYNITKLPTSVFVMDDGDGKWALYTALTTGTNATYVKLSDPDLLNAVMTASMIKSAYESNEDTNAFTNTLLAKLNSLTLNENGYIDPNLLVPNNFSNTDFNVTENSEGGHDVELKESRIQEIVSNSTPDETAFISFLQSRPGWAPNGKVLHSDITWIPTPSGNLAQLPTPVLTGGIATATSKTLSWSAEDGADGYILQRSTNSDFSTDLTTVYNGTATSYNNTGLTTGTTYYWRVLAFGDGFANSDYSNTVDATPVVGNAIILSGNVSESSSGIWASLIDNNYPSSDGSIPANTNARVSIEIQDIDGLSHLTGIYLSVNGDIYGLYIAGNNIQRPGGFIFGISEGERYGFETRTDGFGNIGSELWIVKKSGGVWSDVGLIGGGGMSSFVKIVTFRIDNNGHVIPNPLQELL